MEQYLSLVLLLIILGLTADSWRQLRRKAARAGASRRVLLDTSVLIDGRILELAKTGWLNDELVIPRSVLSELQLLADGSNTDKRTRARYGMDVVAELQRVEQVTVTILPDNHHTPEGVDNRLLELAREQGFALATIDYNLNKIAVVEGVTVLNINELAKVIRLQVLPGERVKIKLIQEGQGKDQAVGYLEDGAMVVVAHAKKHLGETVEVEISRALQTDAGKMVFAELVKAAATQPANKTASSIQTEVASAKTAPEPAKRSRQAAKTIKTVGSHTPNTLNTTSTQATTNKAKTRTKTKTVKPQSTPQPAQTAQVSTDKNTARSTKRRSRKSKSRQDEYLDRIINTTSTKQ